MPAIQKEIGNRRAAPDARRLPQRTEREPASHVEVRQTALGAEIQDIDGLRTKRLSLVDRLAESVSGLEVDSLREAPVVNAERAPIVGRVVIGLPIKETAEAGVIAHDVAVARDPVSGHAVDVERRIKVMTDRADIITLGHPVPEDLTLHAKRPILTVLDLQVGVGNHLAGPYTKEAVLVVQSELDSGDKREIVGRLARSAQTVGGMTDCHSDLALCVGNQRQVVTIPREQLVGRPVVEQASPGANGPLTLLRRVPGEAEARGKVIGARMPELGHVVHLQVGNLVLEGGAALEHAVV